jgi:ubiquitin carboxyl-terminal hydrolase 7
MRQIGYSEHIFIELEIQHQLCKVSEEQEYKGLINEGMTCYLNSLIQTLFFLRAFRNAVYQMPSSLQIERMNLGPSEKNLASHLENIPFCLQRIFYNLQLSKSFGNAVRTHELLQAFGWNNNERNQQQDVNEFNCILSDQLEKQMQNTEAQATYKNLFEGKLQSVV